MENTVDAHIRFKIFLQTHLSQIPLLFTFSNKFSENIDSLSLPPTLQQSCANMIIDQICCYMRLDLLSPTILPPAIVSFLKSHYSYYYFIKISKFIKFLYDHHCSGIYVLDPILCGQFPRETLFVNKLHKFDYFRWRSWEYEEEVPHPTISGKTVTLKHIFCGDCFKLHLSCKNYLQIDDFEHTLFLQPGEGISFFELTRFYCQKCYKPLFV